MLEGVTLGDERDAAVRLQIHLDQKLFGPGFIDGKPGTFTKKAIAAYNETVGRSPDDLDALQQEADQAVKETYVVASCPQNARKFVNTSLPYKRAEQAKEEALYYRSYLEYMAERYHTSEDVLIELNGRKTAWAVRPGKTLFVPNVEPFLIEEIRSGRAYQAGENGLDERRVVIDTKEKQIRVFAPMDVSVASAGEAISVKPDYTSYRLIATFPTTPGQERYIHRGTWKVRNAVECPTWRYDKQMLKEGKRSKEYLNIPGGPNNPIGVMWFGLTKSGIGIHGTDSPRTIGRAQSSGCYRLANWDVARLPGLIRPGAVVEVK